MASSALLDCRLAPRNGHLFEDFVSRLDQLRKLAESQPEDAFAHYGVGLEYMSLERWADAVAAFDRVLTLDPQYTAAYFQKARSQIKLGLRDAAAATLQSGIAAAQANDERHTADEMRKLLETIA